MPIMAHQSMVITLLDNHAMIKHDDAVRVSNGGEAMCDQYSSPVLQDQIKPFLDLRLVQQHLCKCDKLSLPAIHSECYR